MSGKKFDGIDALVDDIKANYLDAEFGKQQSSTGYQVICNGKYRVTNVDSETLRAVFKKLRGLLTKRDVKIIFLVAEEIDVVAEEIDG